MSEVDRFILGLLYKEPQYSRFWVWADQWMWWNQFGLWFVFVLHVPVFADSAAGFIAAAESNITFGSAGAAAAEAGCQNWGRPHLTVYSIDNWIVSVIWNVQGGHWMDLGVRLFHICFLVSETSEDAVETRGCCDCLTFINNSSSCCQVKLQHLNFKQIITSK